MPMLESGQNLRRQLDEALQAISSRSSFHPGIGIIIGSGLGDLTKALQVNCEIDYAQVPNMPRSTSPGHEGKLVLGTLGEKRLAVLAGRFHYYEGYSMTQVTFPVRLIRSLGADVLILTSIVGSMNPQMPQGSLVLLEDHINLIGDNPLRGPNDEILGVRFPDMSEPYDPMLRKLAIKVAKEQNIPLSSGVYVAVTGPNLETKAEYKFLRQIGSDVVGMSMVPEVIVACHAGLRVLAITVVSDACIPERLKPAKVEELLRVAAEAEPKLTALIGGVIERL